ncbi:hypothetical protein Tco_0128049 [Tanacetum coccineum]
MLDWGDWSYRLKFTTGAKLCSTTRFHVSKPQESLAEPDVNAGCEEAKREEEESISQCFVGSLVKELSIPGA